MSTRLTEVTDEDHISAEAANSAKSDDKVKESAWRVNRSVAKRRCAGEMIERLPAFLPIEASIAAW